MGFVALVVALPVLLFVSCPTTGEAAVSASPRKCRSANQFQCLDGGCIPELWRCDGDEDCSNGEDEVGCLEMVQCSGFRCTDGQCLAMVWKCDGQSDCEDGSDEDPLLCKNITCLHNQFQCHSGQCIASNLVCNGIRDCTDSSDENVCPAMQCSSEEFLCGLECISANLLCDGKIDCAGGHDESIKMCKSVSENHCATDEFYCDEECVPFAWRCDGHTDCEDETDEENCEVALLLFNSTSFAKVDINGVRMEDFPFAREKMTALSVDLISSELFWINGEEKGIFRKSFGKNDRQSIIQHVSTAKCITVDWIHKLVFWIDSEFSTISVANYDGSKRKILYKGNISVPSSMAVDPVTGFVFWSDIGDKAKIEKVAINGESRIPLVTVNIKRPVALTLDIKHSLVYWVDSELNTISKIGMGGQHQKVILHSAQFLAKPTGIAVFQDKIFWSDLKHEAIYSIQNNLHSKPTAVTSMTQPLGLLILAREIQPDGVNLCLEHRECPFLYVPSPSNSETKQAKPTAYFDTLDTAQTSDLPKKGNSTTGLHYSTYVRSLVAILSVAFSLFLVSCTIIYFWTKASCNLRNIRLFETSKKYLEKNMDRTTSAAHMLSDLKYEDDDFSGVYRT